MVDLSRSTGITEPSPDDTGKDCDAQNAPEAEETAPAASGGHAPQSLSGATSQAQSAPDDAADIVSPAATASPLIIRQYELVDRVRAYDPTADEDLLNRAYVFSMRAHGGQTRKSGDPYFTHPLSVAGILTELKADPASVATALLHDVVEDTDTTIEELTDLFGAEVADLVDGVTKLSKMELRSRDASQQAENFRKLVMAMAKDVRVLLVKLADRLHNMRTLRFFDNEEKKRRIALETMEIYAPLAGRIGVQRFREELEELSFRVLNPQAYELISHRLDDLHASVTSSVVDIAQVLRAKLAKASVIAEVHSREKRPYSIWRKMSAKNVSFDELADIYGFRIITETVEDCYRALAVAHTTWRMIPSEFDDYISAAKPNNYRSIHTAVVGPPRPDGGRQQIEMQIRTRQMHETAERGVAAHWQYKERSPGGQGRGVEIVSPGHYDPYETPRRLVEMFQSGEDPDEALKYAKLELFHDQVFCFTPKGRVIALPKGGTVLDFAYTLHTDIGDSCIGGKINGVTRPLRTSLKNGDVVVVLRSENAAPPADWESMAVSGRARAAIRRRIKKMKHSEHVARGRAVADVIFSGVNLELTPKAVEAALVRLDAATVDEVFARVGRGELGGADLVEAVYPGASFETEAEVLAGSGDSFRPQRAIDGLPARTMATLATCCTPVPGERIIGIREPSGGVLIHTISCDRLAAEDPPQALWLDLKWLEDRDTHARSHILVTVRNEIGVLSEVASVIARYGVSIDNIRLQNRAIDFVDLMVDVVVKDARQLSQMLAGVRALTNVVNAARYEGDDREN